MTGSRLDRCYPWLVVAASLAMIVVGQGIQFVLAVSLKPIAAELGWGREVPSTAYALSFIGAGIGALYLGHLSDRVGMGPVSALGAVMIGSGAMLVSQISQPWHLYLIYAVMIGLLGNATIFAPLMANTTRWFDRRRGIALGIVASGQSLGGTIWPPLAERFNAWFGWRDSFFWYGVMAIVVMSLMTLILKRRAPGHADPQAAAAQGAPRDKRVLGWPPALVTAMLCAAIVGCCVPMSLPLVHLVAYGTDLGYSPAAAASLLSVALATSFISRVGGGALADRIGGLRTLFIGSAIQASMLAALSVARDLTALYVICAIFGLGYGGIIAMYAYIAREYFPPSAIGRRIAIIYLFGTVGMATGGYLGGVIHDRLGAYSVAFLIGALFNGANLCLIGTLIWRAHFRRPAAAAA